MEASCEETTLEHFETVIHLLKELWPSKKFNKDALYKVFVRGLESESDYLVSAVVDGEVVGFGSLVIKNSFWQESFVGYLTTLVVSEKYRGYGIGKQLIRHFEQAAKERLCKRLELDSGFHREGSHAFYEYIGFNKRGYVFSKELI